MSSEIKNQAAKAARELIDAAGLKQGDIFVVGCSSSDVCGEKIGTLSNYEIGGEVFSEYMRFCAKKEYFLQHSAASILTEAL